jgi:hypothetical protein
VKIAALLAAVLFALAAGPAGAQTWQQAATPHFLFIFEPRDRQYVDELLGFAEDVYARVTGFFDSYPPLVPCVIRGRTDEANGQTMSFPSRIDLYLTAPTDHFLGARTESWLKVLLTHELTHFVHQAMSTGLFHDLSLLFGREIATVGIDFLPGWAVEGPAVYDETVFSEGGRGRNPLFELYTRAAAEEGSLFSLGQAGYLSPFPPRGRIYVAGYALVSWLETTYGQGTFRRIMRDFLAFPFLGPEAAIARGTGKDASTVFAEMRKALTARAAPFIAIPGGSLVTPERYGNWSHPQPTARGLYLYRTTPDAFPAIVRWDPAAQAEQVLVKAPLTDAASFSATADGRSVWFSTPRVDDSRPAEERSTADLFLLDVPSGRVRQVTHGAHLWHPAVSADGSRLLAVQGSGPYARLVAVDQGTGEARALFSRAGGNVYTPAISPDGRTVAFVLNLRGFQDVYVAGIGDLDAGSAPIKDPRSPVADVNAGRGRPVLGPDPFGEYFPSFEDDGSLLFSSDRSGSMSLYAADLASGEVRLVQRDPVAATAGVVEGQALLYSSYASNGYCIKSTPLASLAPETLDPPNEALAYPEPVSSSGADVQARPYTDTARLLFWLPDLTLTRVGSESGDLAFGLGARLQAGSLLGATQWSANAAWLLGADQPEAGIDLTTAMGQVSIDLASRFSYAWSGIWVQAVRSSLVLSWTPLDETDRDVSSSLVAQLGVIHTAELLANGPFTLRDSLGAPPQAWFTYVGVPVGLDYSRSVDDGQIAFNPPRAVHARLSGIVYLPVLSLAAPEGVADLLLSVNVPGFGRGVVKLGIKATQDFGGTYSQYADSYTVPRGFAAYRTRPVPGGLLAAADYLVPLGLLDAPLFLGGGITGAGMGMHVEALANFDAWAGRFAVIPSLYAGLDFTLRFSFDGGSLPVGVGLSAAVDFAAPQPFDPARDLGVYLFFGFDGFTDAARDAASSARAQGLSPRWGSARVKVSRPW